MLRSVSRRLYYTMKSLTDFTISPESVSKLKTMGITEFFPIQADTYNSIISGKDIVAQASTGSGKTIAFALPVIEQLQSRDLDRLGIKGRAPRVLALAPTRELAKQTATVFNNLVSYGGLTILPVYGGTPYQMQESILERGVDVVVGAPGRIKDLVERGSLDLSEVRHVVLDEVDRMLDMGFLPDVDDILKYVYQEKDSSDEEERPQTLLFSATMPPWVAKTSKRYLSKENIAHVRLAQEDTTPSNINHCCLKVPHHSRPKVLSDLIATHVQTQANGRCIIFCERKAEADGLSTHTLMPKDCHVLHGDIPQAKRELVLSKFREGKYSTLITTDVAARGLDIPEVNLVIQCSPPKDTDSYIHRAGRTGRAGRNGLSICLYTRNEEQLIGKVEHDANITFKPMKRPSLVDIVKANKLSTLTSLKAIPDDVVQVFSEAAADIIKEMGAEHALAAALAKMSGRTTSKQAQEASLLSGRDGHTTMEFKYKAHFTPTKSFLYRVIGKKVGEQFGSSISYVKFTKNKESIVFDMDNDAIQDFEKAWVDESRNVIHRLEKLPELEPEEANDGGFRSHSRDRGFPRGGSFIGRKRPFDNNWNSRRPGGARRREEATFRDTSF